MEKFRTSSRRRGEAKRRGHARSFLPSSAGCVPYKSAPPPHPTRDQPPPGTGAARPGQRPAALRETGLPPPATEQARNAAGRRRDDSGLGVQLQQVQGRRGRRRSQEMPPIQRRVASRRADENAKRMLGEPEVGGRAATKWRLRFLIWEEGVGDTREIQDSDGASPRRAGGIFNRFAWARAVEILARYPVSLRFAGRRERMRRRRVWVMCAVCGSRLAVGGRRAAFLLWRAFIFPWPCF